MYSIQTGKSLNDIGTILRTPITYQRGYSYNYLPRRRVYVGRGIGSVLSGAYRFLRPLIIKGLRTVSREFLDAGSDILANKSDEPFEQKVKMRGQQALQNLKRKAVDKLNQAVMHGAGRKGIKRKRLSRKIHSNVVKRHIKPKKAKKRRSQLKKTNHKRIKDIFG